MVPNWSRLTGPVIGVHDAAEGFTDVEVEVAAADPVDDWPNLLDRRLGERVAVRFRAGHPALVHLRPGSVLRARVRCGLSDAVFPDPREVDVEAVGPPGDVDDGAG